MADILAGFDWTTPFIADACVQLSLPVRVGPHGLRCNIPGSKVAGPARPARHAGSTDVFLEAIAASKKGDVLVIDNGGRHDEGCIGDLVVGEAFMSGIAGTRVLGHASRHRRDPRDRRERLESRHLSQWPARVAPARRHRARGGQPRARSR